MSSEFEIFLTDDAFRINQARQNHLASLGLDLAGKRVLEVGAGIGLHTQFFEDLGCSVLTTDGRQENVAEIRRRYPHRQVNHLDLDKITDLSCFGEFDIVYCYGVLYHLLKPEQALQALAQICREMILLETCVTPGNDLEIHPISEDPENYNQARSGIGCRPTRPWVVDKLVKYFGFAYISKYQPWHPDFDLDWQNPVSKLLHRSVFVGSKQAIVNSKLLTEVPDYQAYDPALKKVWLDVGCHLGETTLEAAQKDDCLHIYAFEPNLKLAAQLNQQVAHLPNYAVIPAAVAQQAGVSQFYLNAADATSSLLPFNPERLEKWIGGEELKVESVEIVPTVRLDHFLESLGIDEVDFLKIDAQGADFDVILSAGDKIQHVIKIKLEVAITPTQLYSGATSKADVVAYLETYGFVLVQAEKQSNDQEENLIFIRCDRFSTLPHFQDIIPTLAPHAILQIATHNIFVRPLKCYPGWRFNIEWDNPNPKIQLRRAIWEYFRTNQLEATIKFRWYNDLQLFLYLGNDLSSQLFVAGCYEPNEFNFLSQVLQPGMTFVDIGANDGLYSLFASSYVGDTGTVLAIEPSQREFEHLQDNIKLNGITTIKPLKAALSNVDGQASLKVANYEHAGQNTLGDFVHQGVFCTQTELVAVRRFDHLVDELNLNQIDVIKMDVEGAENLVLEGAKQVLEKHHPLLLLELSDRSLRTQGSSAAEVLTILRSLGYNTFEFGQFTGVPVQSTLGGLPVDNIIAAHPTRTWPGLTELDQMQHLQTELEQTQQHLQRTESELHRSQTALQESESNLEQIQNSLQQLESQYQQCQADLAQTQANLNLEVAAKLETAKEVERLQEELTEARTAVNTLNTIIGAMESSKFWQVRNLWVNLSQRFGGK